MSKVADSGKNLAVVGTSKEQDVGTSNNDEETNKTGRNPEASLVIVIKEAVQEATNAGISSKPGCKKKIVGDDDKPSESMTVVKCGSVPPDDDVQITDVVESKEIADNLWEDKKTLTCAYCKEMLQNRSSFTVHLTAHGDMNCKEHLPLHKTKLCFYNNRYQCYNCKLKTKHRMIFQEHVRHHVLQIPYTCKVCSAGMSSLVEFKLHVADTKCKAGFGDLLIKPTEIVKQVMKMLGPKAPATEHFYSVGLNKDKTQSKVKTSQEPNSKASSTSVGPQTMNESTNTALSSSTFNVPVVKPSTESILESRANVVVDFNSACEPVITTDDNEAILPMNENITAEITATNKPDNAIQPEEDNALSSHTDISPEKEHTANVKEYTLQDNVQIVPEKCNETQTQITTEDPMDETGVCSSTEKIQDDILCAVDHDLQQESASASQDFWQPMIIEAVGSASGLAKSSAVPSIAVPESITPEQGHQVESLEILPIQTGDDNIQVVQVSSASSGAEQVVTTSMGTDGKSADHPIVINDDDLHRANSNTKNKIKIERRSNGIVLRLFQDNNGEMEDLSQLGLEIRDGALFCCRCEHAFKNEQEFLPHVSEELHTIFNFHAGLCPVCKHSPGSCPDTAPCKLAKILYRVLSVVYRSLEKVKAVKDTPAPTNLIVSGGANIPQVPVSPSYPVINIAPQTTYQTDETTISIHQNMLNPVRTATAGAHQAAVSNAGISSPPVVPTPPMTPSGSRIVIMPQAVSGIPTCISSGTEPGTMVIIPVQQSSVITPLVIAPVGDTGPMPGPLISTTPVGHINTKGTASPLISANAIIDPLTSSFVPALQLPQTSNFSTVPLPSTEAPTNLTRTPNQNVALPVSDVLCHLVRTRPTTSDPATTVATTLPTNIPEQSTVAVSTMTSPEIPPPLINTSSACQISVTVLTDATDSSAGSASPHISTLTPAEQTKLDILPDVSVVTYKHIYTGSTSANLVDEPVVISSTMNTKINTTTVSTAVPAKLLMSVKEHTESIIEQSMGLLSTDDRNTTHPEQVELAPQTVNSEGRTKSEILNPILTSKLKEDESKSAESTLFDTNEGKKKETSTEDLSFDSSGHIDGSHGSPTLKTVSDNVAANNVPDETLAANHVHQPELNTDESLPVLETTNQKQVEILSELPSTSPKRSDVSNTVPNVVVNGSATKTLNQVDEEHTSTSRPTPDKRLYVGKFCFKDNKFQCLRCKFQTAHEGPFKIHLSKHIHGKKLNDNFCNHCPPEILYNKMGNCPVLKRMIRMMKQVAELCPTWDLPVTNKEPEDGINASTSQNGFSYTYDLDEPFPSHETESLVDQAGLETLDMSSNSEPDVDIDYEEEEIEQHDSETIPEPAVMTQPLVVDHMNDTSIRSGENLLDLCDDDDGKTDTPSRQPPVLDSMIQNHATQKPSSLVESETDSEKTAPGLQSKAVHLPSSDAEPVPKMILEISAGKTSPKPVEGIPTSENISDKVVPGKEPDKELPEKDPQNEIKHSSEKEIPGSMPDKSAHTSSGALQGTLSKAERSVQQKTVPETQPKAQTEPLIEVPPQVTIEVQPDMDHGDDDDQDTTCSRFSPYQHNKPWPKRMDMETQVLNPPQPSPATSYGPKLFMKCAIEGCDFRTVDEDLFRLHNHVKHAAQMSFPCSYCAKTFADVDDVIRHFDSHKDWVYKCSFNDCSFGARKLPEYQAHLWEEHSTATEFKCCFCVKQSANIDDILLHTERHVRTQIKCPYCEKISLDKKEVQAHIAEQHSNQPKKIVVSTQIIPNLDDDLEQTDQEPNRSTVPGAAVLPAVTSTEPQAAVPPPPPEYVPFTPTACDKCSFISLSAKQEEVHAKLHETTQDKEMDFFCRQCPFSCGSLLEYRVHLQQHTGTSTIRMYMCAHCSYCTMHMAKIDPHLSDDHPDDPFKFEVSQEKLEHMQLTKACQTCGENILSTSADLMAEHVAKHHAKTPVVDRTSSKAGSGLFIERYHCDMCTYSALDGEDLANHLNVTHGGDRKVQQVMETPSPDQYSAPMKIIEKVQKAKKNMALYECDLCSYKTANKKMFIDHHRQHAEGAVPNSYKCDFCPYESSKYKNLVNHQKVHSRPMEEGYKCSYCFYMNTIKSRVSWHISAYHPGKEKKIVEITKSNPVNPPGMPSPAKIPLPRSSPSSHKLYKQSDVLNAEYQAPHATSTSATPATPSKKLPVSTMPQYLNDDDLKDFERNLPTDMIFKHPVLCPFCPFTNRVRVNMLRHLKTHVNAKTSESTVSSLSSSVPVPAPTPSSLPKGFLLFFKRSKEISVFQCHLCEYVHVNGSDMVRHFLCEHAVLGCNLCKHHAITPGRITEHYRTTHVSADLDVYLKRGEQTQRLTPGDFRKIELMEQETMLEQESESSQGSDVVEDNYDFDDETSEVMKHCKQEKINNRMQYRCVYCGYAHGLPMIRRHMLSVHMKFLAYVCKYCKTGHREKYHLQQHIKNVHPGAAIVISRRKFDPQKHGKIVKLTVDNTHRRKRKHSEGGVTAGNKSDSEHSNCMDTGSLGRVTPSRESISSLDSTTLIPPANIKKEKLDTLPAEEALNKRVVPETARIREARLAREAKAAERLAMENSKNDDSSNLQKYKKKLHCAYCDYSSQYIKQDIQRHMLLKHLLIHVYMCRKCKFATNNRKSIEQHRKDNKGHNYREWTDIKEKIVEIHQEGLDVVYGFPEGQLTEIQQQLEKVPGLFPEASPQKGLNRTSLSDVGSVGLASPGSLSNNSGMMDQIGAGEDMMEEDMMTEEDAESFTDSLPVQSRMTDTQEVTSRAVASAKIQKEASHHIKLPKMELYRCTYCDYASKYNRGDVKKHILFKHFMNKKFTCSYCGYGTWVDQTIKQHMLSAHPGQPEDIYSNDFENECIVPVRTTADRCLILGVKTPQNSPIQLQKNILHQCKLCNVEGPNIIKIKFHIIVKHWNMKPFQCPSCDEQRWKRQAVEDHIKKEHPEVNEGPVATYTKKSNELLNLVKKKVVFSSLRTDDPGNSSALGATTVRQIQCRLCVYTAVTQSDLETHMTTHSVFACIYCPFQAVSKPTVQSHIEHDHPDYPVRIKTSMPATAPDQRRSCVSITNAENVQQKAQKRKYLGMPDNQPMRKKFNFGYKPGSMQFGLGRGKLAQRLAIPSNAYSCNMCSHQVDKLRDILEHICKHYNYYRFACSYCEQKTTRAYLIKNHIEKRHPGLEQIYKVNTDDKVEAEMKKAYTMITKSPRKNKECVMYCPLCAKRCSRQSSLREHIMRDINYRPFLCPFCEFSECTGGKVNFHMHQAHKDGSGRYQVKVDNELAGKVQKLMDEAKANSDRDVIPKSTLPKSPPPREVHKPGALVVKFPKIQMKGPPKVKLNFPVKTEPSEDRSREPSVASISSTASDETESSLGYKCHLCSYETGKEKLLKSHLMRTHGMKRWKCYYCTCETVYRSTIIKHVRDTHRNMPMKVVQILPTAKESYKDEPDVEIVMAATAYGTPEPQLSNLLKNRPGVTVSESTPARVKISGGSASLVNTGGLASLVPSDSTDILGPDEKGLYHCGKCSYDTLAKKLLRMHLLCHKDADLECLYCKRIYRVVYRLRRHSRVRHKGRPIKWRNITTNEMKEEPYLPSGPSLDTSFTDITKAPQTLFCCHMCNAAMSTADSLFRHVQEMHSSADSSSMPSRPSSTQSAASSLSQVEDAPYRCTFCSYTSLTPEDLEEHVLTHTTTKPFRCAYCDYSCLYRSEARRHCQRSHPDKRIAVVSRNLKAHSETSKPESLKQLTICLTDILSLDSDSLTILLEQHGIKTLHMEAGEETEEEEETWENLHEEIVESPKPARLGKPQQGPSRRPRRLQCNVEGCDRMFSYSFDVYRHQRLHHNISPAMYQKGVGATFQAFKVLSDHRYGNNQLT